MPLHRWLPAAMVAPTPVSALLHAVAVVKGGVFFLLKVTLYVFGIDLVAKLQTTQWLLYVAAATILLASLVALRQGQSQSATRLFDHQPAGLHCPRRLPGHRLGHHRRHSAHGYARLRQDHPVLLRRRHTGRYAKDGGQRDARSRAGHAVHHVRLPHRQPEHHRPAADWVACLEQVVSHAGLPSKPDNRPCSPCSWRVHC